MEPLARHKNIEIIVEASPSVVLIDENMFHTILQNLLSNAIKYSNHNGMIKITAKQKERLLEIAVIDQGIGMDQDTQNKLFHIDETINVLGTDGERGTGLGLILSKEFVERHRGKIIVESEEGKGSTFTISIPL